MLKLPDFKVACYWESQVPLFLHMRHIVRLLIASLLTTWTFHLNIYICSKDSETCHLLRHPPQPDWSIYQFGITVTAIGGHFFTFNLSY